MAKKEKLEITITVDTNDADFQTDVNKILSEDLKKLRPLIAAIKKFKPYKTNRGSYKTTHSHNYPTGECLREDLGEKTVEELYDFNEDIFELFEEFLPCTDYGFHTIKRIEVCPLVKKEKLL